MTLGKYSHIPMMFCISILLLTVTGVAVQVIYSNDQDNVSHHILTRLQATSGIIKLWEQEYLMSVRTVAEDPGLATLIEDLLNHKITREQASNTLDQWLRPIYLGRGYEGHSIITADMTILLASSPAFVGKKVSSASGYESITKAFAHGSAIARPSEATYQVRMLDRIAMPGTLFQLGCAQITKNGKILAVLCLRQDPYRNFFALLSTGFSGNTGEAYAVDRNGDIVSPTRFGQDVFKRSQPGQASTNQPQFIKGLQARIPVKTKIGTFLVDSSSPLTRGVSEAMKKGESGFLDSYRDYRNNDVVGAVQWLPEMDMGIVVEQDADEVYGPFRKSRNAIIGLGLLATLLINALIIGHHRSRKSLAEREQRMRAFLDNFPGLAHMRDAKGTFLIANRQMEEFLHTSRDQLIGRNEIELPVPNRYLTQLNKDHREVLDSGQMVETIRQVADLKFGNIEWFKTIRFPVLDTDNQIYAVGTILQDITEQTRNAQELEAIRLNLEQRVEERTAQFEAAKLEAEQALKVKAEFLANMSHEIRTPMNAIIGLSHLATMVSDDPKMRSYLQRIHQSSSHLLSIINDILDFSKIEAGKMTIENTDFSLEDMLNKVIGLLWEKADDKGLELLVDIDKNIPENLNGDALRIGQVLINFVSNAVKFTETGDVILRARKLYDDSRSIRVRFEVQDTGIGIAPDRFDQLFKPFQQLDTSSTRRFEGTGLGLTISKNLVELMGGKLDMQSNPSVGSTFALELSLNKCKQQEIITHLEQAEKYRVLVVDDNQHAREIFAQMLDNLSLTVSQADSGLAAVDLILAQEDLNLAFDIIFLDWKMPGISGVETAERITQLPLGKQPKLVLTSAHSKQDIGANQENLFCTILSKPIVPSALIDALRSLLQNAYAKPQNISPVNTNHYKKLNNSHVLLVDDNDINQAVVKELLKLVNINITLASNGQEALDKLHGNYFDAILMDVQMPVMDGIEATRRIRVQNTYEELPIIAMTANAQEEDRDLCLKAGMSDYISKPIDPDILFRTLLRWLGKKNISVEAPAIATNNTKNASVLATLNKLDALDLEPALERLLNNGSFYLKLLERFVTERSNVVEVIEKALARNDYEEASRQAHTFKSLAGTVGATTLQELALIIEINLREGIAVALPLANLQNAMEEFTTAVKATLPEQTL